MTQPVLDFGNIGALIYGVRGRRRPRRVRSESIGRKEFDDGFEFQRGHLWGHKQLSVSEKLSEIN